MTIKSRLHKLEAQQREEEGCGLCRPQPIRFIEEDAADLDQGEPSAGADRSPRCCSGCGRWYEPQISFIEVVRPRQGAD